ncbi:MAG: TetR/AcrR family transcriptional regulator [Ferruginibacter sp.]
MSKAEDTRAFIIEKTAPIFNTKGYAGTSLTDITEATGLTKGSIYGNFANKDEVAIAVYDYHTCLLSKKLDEVIGGQESATGKLMAMTGYYRTNWKKMFERGGCPILNASVEADDNLPFLKKNVQTSIRNWATRITGIIEEGKKSGEFKKNINAVDFSYNIITLIEGGIMLAKITNNQHLLFSALDRAELIIKVEIKK